MRISDWSSDVCSSDLLRAITEAALVRTTYLSGARDDLREDDFDPGFLAQRARWARALGEKETGAVDFSLLPDLATASINEDFLVLKRQLQIGRAHVELQSLMRISYAVFCLKQKKLHHNLSHLITLHHIIVTYYTQLHIAPP